MVATKGRVVGGIRILDESKSLKNAKRDFKGEGIQCRGVAMLSRKPVLVNTSSKFKEHTDLENEKLKERMKSGRKALVDIGNLNNRRSQQNANQLSSKPKLISWKDKFDGTKKVALEGSKMSRGLSLAKGIVIADLSLTKSTRENVEGSVQITRKVKFPERRKTLHETHVSKEIQNKLQNFGSDVSKIQAGQLHQKRFVVLNKAVAKKAATTRKPVASTSNLQRAVMTKKASITKKFEATMHSENKELEEPGTSSNYENLRVSQDIMLNGVDFSNDIVKTKVVSVCKCDRRKSFTLSLIRRGCDGGMNKDFLANIDDFSNSLEVADYVDDIYQYYWTMEVERPVSNYREIQSEITPKMRSILVNWLIEVHHKYQLMEESLFLMIELLDRLLSLVNVKKNELQLFGLATLLLASKYEDYWHPKVGELISLSVNQYTKDEMLGMEMLILKKLQFRLSVPTPYVFMLRFLRAAQSNKKLEDLSFYLVELCLVENESMKYKPSLLCASAIFVARISLKLSPPWTGLLTKHARYEESELRNCAEMILRFQRAATCCKPVKYTYQKYLKPDRSCAASMKPIRMLPP